MFDRAEARYLVIDVDRTVSAARQRSVEKDWLNYPPVRRRSDKACAPGYKGRKRGEVSRTRTTILVAQTSEWLGSYGRSGNGDAKGELEQVSRSTIIEFLRSFGEVVSKCDKQVEMISLKACIHVVSTGDRIYFHQKLPRAQLSC